MRREVEGRRRGKVGELLLSMMEQSVDIDGLLNQEKALTNHLYEISTAPESLWPILINHFVKSLPKSEEDDSKAWTVKDVRHWVAKVKEFDIPPRAWVRGALSIAS